MTWRKRSWRRRKSAGMKPLRWDFELHLRLAMRVIKLQFGKIRRWMIATTVGTFQNIADEFYRLGYALWRCTDKENGDVDLYEEFKWCVVIRKTEVLPRFFQLYSLPLSSFLSLLRYRRDSMPSTSHASGNKSLFMLFSFLFLQMSAFGFFCELFVFIT